MIAGQTFKTDGFGKAAFTVQIPKSATHVVVTVKKDGFIALTGLLFFAWPDAWYRYNPLRQQ